MTRTQQNVLRKMCSAAILAIMFFSFALPVAFADTAPSGTGSKLDYTPLVALPGVTETGTGNISNLSTYVVGMFKLLIGVAILLAVVMITIGGLEYMSTDAINGKQNGKERIQNALWGLALAIASYLILYTIDPSFLNSDLNNVNSAPPAQSQSTTAQ